MRGSIIAARIAYPDVLHVEVRDSQGALWRLATQGAEWSPSDPAQLVGRSIEEASIDELLESGPGFRWQISSADVPVTARR